MPRGSSKRKRAGNSSMQSNRGEGDGGRRAKTRKRTASTSVRQSEAAGTSVRQGEAANTNARQSEAANPSGRQSEEHHGEESEVRVTTETNGSEVPLTRRDITTIVEEVVKQLQPTGPQENTLQPASQENVSHPPLVPSMSIISLLAILLLSLLKKINLFCRHLVDVSPWVHYYFILPVPGSVISLMCGVVVAHTWGEWVHLCCSSCAFVAYHGGKNALVTSGSH